MLFLTPVCIQSLGDGLEETDAPTELQVKAVDTAGSRHLETLCLQMTADTRLLEKTQGGRTGQ